MVEDMDIDHRRLNVAMTPKLLDGSNVIDVFEQVGGEGIPQHDTLGLVQLWHGSIVASFLSM
jgi:hypothetical protein